MTMRPFCLAALAALVAAALETSADKPYILFIYTDA